MYLSTFSGVINLSVTHKHISIEYYHFKIVSLVKLIFTNAIMVSYLLAWGSETGTGSSKPIIGVKNLVLF